MRRILLAVVIALFVSSPVLAKSNHMLALYGHIPVLTTTAPAAQDGKCYFGSWQVFLRCIKH